MWHYHLHFTEKEPHVLIYSQCLNQTGRPRCLTLPPAHGTGTALPSGIKCSTKPPSDKIPPFLQGLTKVPPALLRSAWSATRGCFSPWATKSEFASPLNKYPHFTFHSLNHLIYYKFLHERNNIFLYPYRSSYNAQHIVGAQHTLRDQMKVKMNNWLKKQVITDFAPLGTLQRAVKICIYSNTR